MFDSNSCVQLEQDIQKIIKKGIAKLSSGKGKMGTKSTSYKHVDGPKTEDLGGLFLKQEPFASLLPTVTLFLEQEPVSCLAMNLDVNYCHVRQENYFKKGETAKTMEEMIFLKTENLFRIALLI